MISKVIRNVLAEWKKEGFTPAGINESFCEDFAENVTYVFDEGVKITWGMDEVDRYLGPIDLDAKAEVSLGHCFLLYKGKFFDSERPDGVGEFLDLPFFQRSGAAYWVRARPDAIEIK